MSESFNNVLSYPKMARQREENIQSQQIAYAEDVNVELNHIIDTYNQLIMMLTGEWGDETGRIYEMVDNAVTLANQAISKVNNCVLKTGDTMTGQLNTTLVPTSDYNVVNKFYVDDTIDRALSAPNNKISELENFKTNLDAKQVKLSNTNFTAKNVHDGMSELFISVSNGKQTVADAITGKGVATSGDASFKQMADNINAILTFSEGTAGGTATAADIKKNKTAYARGSLIVGTYVPLDTSDATATSDEIMAGYTAYVKGGKVIGTYTPQGQGGIDTSDATALAGDILSGKTAYARGVKLVGTYTPQGGGGGGGTGTDNIIKYTGKEADAAYAGVVASYSESSNCETKTIVYDNTTNTPKYYIRASGKTIETYLITDNGVSDIGTYGKGGPKLSLNNKRTYTCDELNIKGYNNNSSYGYIVRIMASRLDIANPYVAVVTSAVLDSSEGFGQSKYSAINIIPLVEDTESNALTLQPATSSTDFQTTNSSGYGSGAENSVYITSPMCISEDGSHIAIACCGVSSASGTEVFLFNEYGNIHETQLTDHKHYPYPDFYMVSTRDCNMYFRKDDHLLIMSQNSNRQSYAIVITDERKLSTTIELGTKFLGMFKDGSHIITYENNGNYLKMNMKKSVIDLAAGTITLTQEGYGSFYNTGADNKLGGCVVGNSYLLIFGGKGYSDIKGLPYLFRIKKNTDNTYTLNNYGEIPSMHITDGHSSIDCLAGGSCIMSHSVKGFSDRGCHALFMRDTTKLTMAIRYYSSNSPQDDMMYYRRGYVGEYEVK